MNPSSKLSPEDRKKLGEELLELLKELRKRKAERPIDFYRPMLHQAPFHTSQARERAAFMSNRAGKSEMGVVEDIRYSLGINPHRKIETPNVGWVISVSNEAQRDILQPKFSAYLPPSEIKQIRYRRGGVWDQLILRNDSIIGFKSAEMGRDVLQGTALWWAHFDEESPKEIYDEVKMRLTDHKGDLWYTMTPINGLTWVYDAFVDPQTAVKGCEIFRASMWDNAKSRGGYIDDDEIKRIEESISDPVMRRIRIYGEFHSTVGQIYKVWDPKYHVIPELPPHLLGEDGLIKNSLDTYCRIDTGRCFAATFHVVDYLGNVFQFAEYYCEDQPINVHARAIVNLCNQHGIWPEFKVDWSTQFFLDLAEHGITCSLADNDVEKGINAVNEYLAVNPARKIGPTYSNPRFYVVGPKCPRTLFEFPRYMWDTPATSGAAIGEKKNKPRKKDDHVLDTIRYLCVDRPSPSRPPENEDTRPIGVRIHQRIKDRLAGLRKKQKWDGDDGFGLEGNDEF